MNYTMEQIDEVRKRAKVGYELAKEGLDHSGGDVLEALIYLENLPKQKQCPMNDTMDKLKGLIDEGFISQIQIKKNGSVLFDIPVVAGVAMMTFWTLPFAAAIFTAVAMECDIRVVKRDGAQSVVTEVTGEKLSELVGTLKAEFGRLKDKVEEKIEDAKDKKAECSCEEE